MSGSGALRPVSDLIAPDLLDRLSTGGVCGPDGCAPPAPAVDPGDESSPADADTVGASAPCE